MIRHERPIKLTPEEIKAIHWFLNRVTMEDYLRVMPVELDQNACIKKAIEIRDAFVNLQHSEIFDDADNWTLGVIHG